MAKHSEVPKSKATDDRQKSKKPSPPSPETSSQSFYQQNLFFSLALDMTWQLALVVIIPIVGGFILDKHYHTTPWIMLAGFVVAAIGVFGVLNHVVSQANQRSQYRNDGEKT